MHIYFFLAPTATMLNANQYATTLACPISNATNPGTTLLTTTTPTTTTASPYIFLSTSDEVCSNPVGGNDLTGKTATLSSPSTLYFYNNNSTPTIYPTEFLRL